MNGVVVLPPEAKLLDGTPVEVTPLEGRADDPPFLRAILDLAKPRDWPEDFALNHAHYRLHFLRGNAGPRAVGSPYGGSSL